MTCLGLTSTAEIIQRRAKQYPCDGSLPGPQGVALLCILYHGHSGGCVPADDPPDGYPEVLDVCCEYMGWGQEMHALLPVSCPVECPCHTQDCHPRTNMKRPYLPPVIGEGLDQGFGMACNVAFPGITKAGLMRHWETLRQIPQGYRWTGAMSPSELMLPDAEYFPDVPAYDRRGNPMPGYCTTAVPLAAKGVFG